MSSHLSCECQDVKIAADKTFGLYLFIGGNNSGSMEDSVEHNNKKKFKVLTLILYNIVNLKIPTENIDQKRLKRYRR